MIKTEIFGSLPIDAKIDRLRDHMIEIEHALTGNGFGVDRGLVGIVKNMETAQKCHADKIEALEDTNAKVKWTLAGAITGASIGTGGVLATLLHFFGG